MSGSDRNRDISANEDRVDDLVEIISRYFSQTNYDVRGQGDIDKIERDFGNRPRDFITPNPNLGVFQDASQNWAALKKEYNIVPAGEKEDLIADESDRVEDEIRRGVGRLVDDVGAVEVADYIYNDIPTGDEQAEAQIDDLLSEYPPDLFTNEIENRLRNLTDRVGAIDLGSDDSETLAKLNELTQRDRTSIGAAIDDIEDQLQDAKATVQQRFLTRFEQAFGQRFGDVDDAINSLRDQFDTLQDLDIETVRASFLGGRDTPNVSLEAGFAEYEDAVLEAIDSVIDLEATADSLRLNRKTPFADVRIRQGEIEQIDYGKAIENAKIVIREDAEIDPDRAIDIDGIEVVTSVDPESVADDDDDDDTTPDLPDDFEGVNEAATEAAQQALIQAEERTGPPVVTLAEVLSVDDAITIAAAVDRDRLPPAIVSDLKDVVSSASFDEREQARAANREFRELQSQLGLDPSSFQREPDVETFDRGEPDDTAPDRTARNQGVDPDRGGGDDRVPGERRRDVRNEVMDALSALGAVGDEDPSAASNVRTQANSDRPDPFQRQAAQRIAPLLQNELMIAQQWVNGEQERLDFNKANDVALSPAEFYEQKPGFVGPQVTKEQFVNLTV